MVPKHNHGAAGREPAQERAVDTVLQYAINPHTQYYIVDAVITGN
jgi:hypothetical protein